MEEWEPSNTFVTVVCYYCFHGDQLKLSFDNVVSCKRAGDGDEVFDFRHKNPNNFTACFSKLANNKMGDLCKRLSTGM